MIDLAVVTSAWGSYGRFLPRWVASLHRQEVRPSLVTVVDAGLDDIGPARQALCETDLDWQIVAMDYAGMGAARNRAVEASPTQWVMHLDADDWLLPYALADVDTVVESTGCDVVSLGMDQGGEERVFPHASREAVLRGAVCCFSCAPFRRELWQRRPFITVNDWVDSAFWVGLAHEGAQFVPTLRAGAVYELHEDSFTRRLTPADREQARMQHGRLCANPGLRIR